MQVDPMLSIAQLVAKGDIGKDYVYCMDEETFYHYEENYWKRLHGLELESEILQKYNSVMTYTVTRRRQILDNLRLLIYRKLEEFNKTGFLNFPEGEMDMETGYIHEHKKENYSTLRMPYHFRFGADCPLWEKTLDEIFEGNKEKVEVLQEFFGYCLTRDTKQRKALLLIGESNCGKSTILWTLRNLLGEKNCSAVSIQNINNPQYTANLMNKLVNIDTDVSQDARSYEEQFKKIAGGEAVGCNPKYIAPFEFLPYARIIMGSNGFPRVTDHSEAFFNRLIMIPCERIFNEEEQNKDLPELLKGELSGIFNWAWEGLQRLNDRGRFEIKDFMKQAKQDLRDESNPIDVFFRETIIVTKSWESYINKQVLYNKYLDWCKNNGNVPMSNIKFGKAVFQKYSKVTEKNSMIEGGIRVWRNLDLKDNAPPQENLAWQE